MRLSLLSRLVIGALVLSLACDQPGPTSTFSTGGTPPGGSSGGSTGSNPAPPPPPPTNEAPATISLRVGPPSLLAVGDSLQLAADVRSAWGTLLGTTVTWASSDAKVATVSASGMLRAVGPGTTTITARADTVTTQRTLSVVTAVPASVVFTSVPANVLVGDSVKLIAEARDASGRRIDGAAVTYGSATTAIAAGSSSGGPWIRGVAPGVARVYATSGPIVTDTAITVTSGPVTQVTIVPSTFELEEMQPASFTVHAFTSNGTEVFYRPTTVTVASPAIASATNGYVQGRAVGTTTFTVDVEGRQATGSISVVPAVLTGVGVNPSSASVEMGATYALTAFANSKYGAVSGRAYTWASLDTAIASVSSSGVVTGRKVGIVTITASSGGLTGSSVVAVKDPAVATIELTAARTTMAVGDTVRAVATLKSATGLVLTGRTLTWRTSNNAAAIVSFSGLVRAMGKGTATISVTCEGKTAQLVFTVN